MTDNNTTSSDSRLRAIALRHACNIADKKRLQAHITDLVLECFDLPSSPQPPVPIPAATFSTESVSGRDADPANPSPADAKLFKTALSFFQPRDFDDLVHERNVDERCGYALCGKPNQRVKGAGEKVWNRQGGKAFEIVDRGQMERWCSKRCGERAGFVRAQLGTEPAWLREGDGRIEPIVLLDEMRNAPNTMTSGDVGDGEMAEKMKALSLERGEMNVNDVDGLVEVFEKTTVADNARPPELGSGDVVEGHQPRGVRFADDGDGGHSQDEDKWEALQRATVT